MLSVDSNILLYGLHSRSPYHEVACRWLETIRAEEDVAISELVLSELYGLIRNRAVYPNALGAAEAVQVIQTYRNHPRWQLIGFPARSRKVHDELWERASVPNFAFRRIYDVRAALTMTAQGVTAFATANVKDYEGLGFERVWNPLLD